MNDNIALKVNGDTPEFTSFVSKIVEKNKQYMQETFPSLAVDDGFMVNIGRRYIGIFRGNSIHAFVDRINGDVLKPASWRAPAKHARGNIFNPDNGMDCMGPYGPKYLR